MVAIPHEQHGWKTKFHEDVLIRLKKELNVAENESKLAARGGRNVHNVKKHVTNL